LIIVHQNYFIFMLPLKFIFYEKNSYVLGRKKKIQREFGYKYALGYKILFIALYYNWMLSF